MNESANLMQDWLTARAGATPDRVALTTGGTVYTYAALHARVANLCARLAAAGVERGDRVGVALPNGFAYAALVHAAIRLGAVLVPLNMRLTAGEMGWQITRTGCGWLVHDGAAGAAMTDESCLPLLADDLLAGDVPEGYAAPYLRGVLSLSDPCAILFTSGTSGRPKGAVLTHENFYTSAMASAYRLGVLPTDRWLCVLPLYHVGGLSILLRSALYGTAVDLHSRFDLAAVDHSLRTEPITLISLVPTMLYRLLEQGAPRSWTGHLRLILLGGAAASPELLARCHEIGLPVATTYGLSEAASQVATALPDDARRKPGSVGKPLMFTSVRIADEGGHDVPTGAYGEIVIGGPTVMRGYYEDPDATAQALRDGELYTGDIGYRDEDGDLWMVQRRGDLIVSGGENIYPAEVERVLRQHPAVGDVCVVGVAHPEWGQQVAAAIVLAEGQTATTADLLAFCRQHLAGYKQPRLIRLVDALPQTASGKVQRGAVVELFT